MTYFPVVLFAFLCSVMLAGCGGSGSSSPASPPANPPPANSPPAGLSVTAGPVFTNLSSFSQALAMHQAPGDSSFWYIAERAGRILRFANNSTVSATEEFIDISSLVDSSAGEAGLLGFAFHPQYQSNRQVFLSYTRSGLVSHIARFTSLDGGMTLDPATEETILTVIQDSNNHNGGHIAFGPDGLLYIGLGDGGGGNDPNDRAQDTTNLLGALLRIDVDGGSPYAIPANNPFSANAPCQQGFGSADCPEIYAWGLRNPWRWSFDSSTGDLWLGDVGQSNWEEVNQVSLGGNYGWRIREGANCNSNINPNCDATGLIDPVAEYDHTEGFSVTGGYVYRGASFADLQGIYLYGDFGSGRIWGLSPDGQGGFTATELAESGRRIATFAEANDGELYIIDYADGRIYQIRVQ